MKRAKVGKKIDMQALRDKYLPLAADDMRLLPPASWESYVFKYLRCAVATAGVQMSGSERSAWIGAKASGGAEDFAEENGWTLSQAVPAMVKERLSRTVDYLAFEDGWERAVGPGWPLRPTEEWLASLGRYINAVADRGLWDRDESK